MSVFLGDAKERLDFMAVHIWHVALLINLTKPPRPQHAFCLLLLLKGNWELTASKVRAMIAEELGVGTTQHSYNDLFLRNGVGVFGYL